jgi:uncharacterized protein (TIGR00251 family)
MIAAARLARMKAMLRASNEAVLISVRVRPRAARTRIVGVRGDRLVLDVTAPPVEDRANTAVCKLIADVLHVAPSRVTIGGGGRGRDKLVRVEAIKLEDAARLLES